MSPVGDDTAERTREVRPAFGAWTPIGDDGGDDGGDERGESRPSSDLALPSRLQHTPQSTIRSTADALDDEERTRTRLLGLSGFAVNALAVVALPLFGGTTAARAVFLAGLLIHALSNFGLFWVARERERFTERSLMVLWCASFVGLHLVTYFFGALTVASVAIVLGLYIVGGTRFQRVALASYVTAAVGNAALVASQLAGWLPDLGVVPVRTLSTGQALAMLVLLQAMFIAVRLIGVEARRSLASAMDELHDATRAIAQREALLEEARDEFRRAKRIGGRGRFTDAVLGGFSLGPILGRGGMGEIYEAVQIETAAPAAVKVLRREAVQQPETLERFFRECKILGSVVSPHVVSVLEVGGPPDEVPYIAMERLVGQDLSSHLGDCETMEMNEVLRLVAEVGEGLGAAAAAGVVHRDVKPHNIFVVHAGKDGVRYKVLDFGISKLADSSGTLTEGQIVGTPGYMAPEQASGGQVSHRTDLYGLAAVAYRALLGVAPFRGRDPARVLLAVSERMPRRPSSLASVSEQVDDVFAIALAKDPADRFDSHEALSRALEHAAAGRLDESLRRRAARLLARRPWPAE